MKKNTIIKNLIVGIVMLCTVMCSIPSFLNAANGSSDFTDTKDVTSTYAYQYKDKNAIYHNIVDNMHINQEDFTMIKGKYSFTLKDDVIDTGRSIKSGDFIYFSFPDFADTPSGNGTIFVEGTTTILATWEVVKVLNIPKIKLTFSSSIDDQSVYDIKGHFEFEFNIKLHMDPNAGDQAFTLPLGKDASSTIYIKPYIPESTTPTQISKSSSYDASTHQITWTIQPTTSKQDWTGYKLEDILPSELSLISISAIDDTNTSIALAKDIDYTHNLASRTITINPLTNNMKKINITTLVNSDLYEDKDLNLITNIANLIKPIDAPIDAQNLSTSSTQTIQKDWIKKSGSPINGNMIKWNIDVNKEKLAMKNGVITDTLQSDLVFDENTTISINNKPIKTLSTANIPSDDSTIYATQSLNTDGTKTLKIYLPRNAKDTMAYNISFITPVKYSLTNTTYSNVASFTSDYWTGTGDTYSPLPPISYDSGAIGLPAVNINKRASLTNKKEGIITWSIIASTNRAEYGTTKITDTINKDDMNLTYTGNMSIKDLISNETKKISFRTPQDGQPAITTTTIKNIDGSDESIRITVNGNDYTTNQMVTIEFSGNNSLKNAKEITLETKIKESIYVSKKIAEDRWNFKNHADVTIYDNLLTTIGSDTTDSNIDITNKLNEKSIINKHEYPNATTLENVDNNPRAYFKLTINPNESALRDTTVKDDLNQMVTMFKKTNTYEEKLGAKWTYVPSSIIIKQKNIDSYSSDDLDALIKKTEQTYTTSKNILSFDFTEKEMNTSYDIYFIAEINRIDNGTLFEKNNFEENGTIAVKNNMSVLHHSLLPDNEVIESKKTAQKDICDHTLVAKTGVYNKTSKQIEYKIKINQRKQNLGNPMIVDDFMSDAITLDPTSVRLYKDVLDENGSFKSNLDDATIVNKKEYSTQYAAYQKDVTHPNATSKAVFTLPSALNKLQDEAYILVYFVDINDGHFNEKIQNDASLRGIHTDTGSLDSSSSVNVDDASGGSSTQRCSATLHKLDDQGLPLENATFDLLLNDHDTQTYLKSKSTDSNGELTFTGLKPNLDYVIKESSAPIGYGLSDETWELTPTQIGTTYMRATPFINKKLESASIPIEVSKTLHGKDWINTRSFQMNLGKTETTNFIEDMQALSYRPTEQITLTNNKRKDQFPTETYSYQSGIRYIYYKVEETALTPGYTNMTGTYYIRLKVQGDDASNTFTTTVDAIQCVKDNLVTNIDTNTIYDGHKISLGLINNYQATPLTYKIKGSTQFDTGSSDNSVFVYELYKRGMKTPLYAVKSAANGNFEIPELSYDATQIGEHHYILGVRKDRNGISYDTTFDILITIRDDDQGTLYMSVSITKDGNNVDNFTFHHSEQANTEVIENSKTPKSYPNGLLTGDTTSFGAYITVILSSTTVLAYTLLKRNKRKIIKE